jgi:FHA domain
MLYQLVCLQGSLAGHVVMLGNETISFGRLAGSTLTITHALASQQHAELRCEKGGYALHDLQSQHGTFINGSSITSQTLRVGDLIDIGGEQFRFEKASDESTLNAPVRIIALGGASVGRIYPLNAHTLTFGRHINNTIKIPNKLLRAIMLNCPVREDTTSSMIYAAGTARL